MTYTYAGFLSYAHADEAVAARLHRALETYKIPKGQTETLTPIFRDTTELTAHHSLSEKIHDAVKGSRVLIVLCSPAAKLSHWVNEEIRLFRALHGEASILCVLAEGTPETAFPPALLEGGREPLAANLGGSKDSFRLGVTQIAAAMLGVGLDTLIQRDTRRKRRRLQTVTAGALVFSTIMGVTALSAVTARKAAETSRMQAEGLVEYMITDLKEKLEPVGRLDILNGIGARAVEYYDSQDIEKLSDDSLARQARARHVIGQVALDAGEFEAARTELEAAARLTQEVYDRNPTDTDAIFAHAQSEYWVGEVSTYESSFEAAMPHMKKYAELGEILYQIDPKNIAWNMERAWGANNVGRVYYLVNKKAKASKYYLNAADYFGAALKLSPNNSSIQFELANVWAGLANIADEIHEGSVALNYRRKQIQVYDRIMLKSPNNYKVRFSRLQTKTLIFSKSISELQEDEALEILEFCFQEYESLFAHDPENESWRRNYDALIEFLSGEVGRPYIKSLGALSLPSRLRDIADP